MAVSMPVFPCPMLLRGPSTDHDSIRVAWVEPLALVDTVRNNADLAIEDGVNAIQGPANGGIVRRQQAASGEPRTGEESMAVYGVNEGVDVLDAVVDGWPVEIPGFMELNVTHADFDNAFFHAVDHSRHHGRIQHT